MVSKYLLSIYLFSSLCGCILFLFFFQSIDYPHRITIESVSFHLATLFFMLFPVINFSKDFSVDKIKISEKTTTIFSWAIIIPSIISDLLSAIDVTKIFVYHDFLTARRAFLSGELSNLYTDNYGVFGYLPSFGPQISFLALFFFFYRYFCIKKKDYISALLFISSFAIVLNNLAIVGREGFVRWFLYLGFCWCLFRKYIPFRRYKRIYLLSLSTLFIIGTFFMAITSDRFEDTDDEGTVHSLVLYAGEPTIYFSYKYDSFYERSNPNIGYLFPLVSGVERENYNTGDRVYSDFRLNTFSTITGSFLGITGGFVCLIITMVWCIILLIILKNPKNGTSLTTLIMYLFAYEIVMLGVLYYLHGNRFTQLSIVAYIFLAYYLCNSEKNKNRMVKWEKR